MTRRRRVGRNRNQGGKKKPCPLKVISEKKKKKLHGNALKQGSIRARFRFPLFTPFPLPLPDLRGKSPKDVMIACKEFRGSERIAGMEIVVELENSM